MIGWMHKTVVAGVIGMMVAMGGCASMRSGVPSCDGAERRPLNKGRWAHDKRAELGANVTVTGAATPKPCGRV
jgi:hypothetical protein